MLDETDIEILNILQKDGRTSNAEIARQVGLVPSAILERIRKLQEQGVIQGYEARISPQALRLGLVAFILVQTDQPPGSTNIGEQLAAIPQVQEVHLVAGEDCYLIKVRVADTEALGQLLRDQVGAVESVRSTRTTIVLTTLKETLRLPIE